MTVTVTRNEGSVSIVAGKWTIAGSFKTDKDGWLIDAKLEQNTSKMKDEDALDLLKAAADEYTIGGARTVVEVELADLKKLVGGDGR